MLEWQDSDSETVSNEDSVRCLTNRLGYSLRRSEHRRLLVPAGENIAHQLLGAPCSGFSNEVFSERSLWNFSSTAIGQLHGSSIHKQPWRDCVTSSYFSGKIPVVMGTGKRYSDNGPAHTQSVQHSSRLRIEVGERSVRLEAGSQSVPENQSSFWPTGSGPVGLSTQSPITSILQLEVGPSIRGCGCISAGLEGSERICQSTLVSDRTCTQQDKSPGGSSDIGSPSVEGPSLVPSSSGDAERLSTAHPSSGISASERGDPENPRNNSSVSRVACLWERYRDSQLSTEASDFMLASWRTKSTQSYESHFGKWACWCSERGHNPVSGPIANVANFLAHLHEEGYQSRSLNAYRSAISSVHDTVDGVEVGKRPVISRLLKGAYHARPPLSRYTCTWDVQVVLHYFESLGPSMSLSLKLLTFKLVMLMALTRPSCSADLASQGRILREFFFPSFPHNGTLCPVETLKVYERFTAALRPKDTNKLFVAIKKPHQPVTSCTIARWLKETLRLAGINVSIFSGHSVRGASTSAAAGGGVTMNDILQAADYIEL